MHTYNPEEMAAMNPAGGYRRLKGSDQAIAEATGDTPVAISQLSFPVKAGQTWRFDLMLFTTGVSGGGKVSISGPASPNLLRAQVHGLVGGVTAFSQGTLTALDTLSIAFNTTAVVGLVQVTGVISPSADGTVSFNGTNVTNGNSFTIHKGSTLLATRIS